VWYAEGGPPHWPGGRIHRTVHEVTPRFGKKGVNGKNEPHKTHTKTKNHDPKFCVALGGCDPPEIDLM